MRLTFISTARLAAAAAARRMRIERRFLPLAQSQKQHTIGRDLAIAVNDRVRLGFAREIAQLGQPFDAAAQLLVEGLDRLVRLAHRRTVLRRACPSCTAANSTFRVFHL